MHKLTHAYYIRSGNAVVAEETVLAFGYYPRPEDGLHNTLVTQAEQNECDRIIWHIYRYQYGFI